MSRWRPSPECLYVIPDIHGSIEMLTKICNRILPLRKSDGVRDRIVFLGDYIDRHQDSPEVIDYLIDLKKKYDDQVIFLMGNHEYLLLESLDRVPGKTMSYEKKFHSFKMWMNNGGKETILGYVTRMNGPNDWGSLPLSRIGDFIPREHIEFYQGLRKYYESGDFIFVHGGCDPASHPSKQDIEEVIWDRDLIKRMITCIQMHVTLPKWEKTIVCGHTPQSNHQPIITEKFMMLDCGSPDRLLVVEMNSLEAYMAYPGQSRMVRYELTETTSIPGLVRRS